MTKKPRLSSIALVSGLAMAAAAWAADYNTAVKQSPLMSWTGRSPAPELANEDPVAVAKQVDKLLIEDVAAADTARMSFNRAAARATRFFCAACIKI